MSYSVQFGASFADQALLHSVEQRLAVQATSFSDLCKQALQHYLAQSESSIAALLLMQQQITQLQQQVAQLEQALPLTLMASHETQPLPCDRLRLDFESASIEMPIEAPDPLLSRLAPLLDEF
jgi:hypothetical protein